jgi:large subunit ribosomal protein L25
MQIAEIEARPREGHGSRACRRLRKNDLLPAVIYGRGEANVLLSVRRSDVEKLMASRAFIVQVNWNGQRENAQLKEVQYDALGDDILHVDFVRISLTEMVTVSVPIQPHGRAAGVAEGGTLEILVHELQVECLPMAIPDRLRVEVTHLGLGSDLRVADVQFPEGVRPLDAPDTVVLSVVAPQELPEEEVAPAVEQAAAEPEVIGRKAEGPEAEEEEK